MLEYHSSIIIFWTFPHPLSYKCQICPGFFCFPHLVDLAGSPSVAKKHGCIATQSSYTCAVWYVAVLCAIIQHLKETLHLVLLCWAEGQKLLRSNRHYWSHWSATGLNIYNKWHFPKYAGLQEQDICFHKQKHRSVIFEFIPRVQTATTFPGINKK